MKDGDRCEQVANWQQSGLIHIFVDYLRQTHLAHYDIGNGRDAYLMFGFIPNKAGIIFSRGVISVSDMEEDNRRKSGGNGFPVSVIRCFLLSCW